MKLKQILLKILIAILVTIIIGIVITKYGVMRADKIELNESVIEQIIRDVYTPSSMEQFEKSAEKFNGTVLSEKVTKDFYSHLYDELSENDLKRSIDINVKHYTASNNSSGEEYYKADVELKYYDGTVDSFNIIFYVDYVGIVDSYVINPNN